MDEIERVVDGLRLALELSRCGDDEAYVKLMGSVLGFVYVSGERYAIDTARENAGASYSRMTDERFECIARAALCGRLCARDSEDTGDDVDGRGSTFAGKARGAEFS